jgi:catechol 2,3-dioxygenase-like lactoylglutathione lyase family enzyme
MTHQDTPDPTGRTARVPPAHRDTGPRARRILETVVYCEDLDAAEHFYAVVLGLDVIVREAGRHVFFRAGPSVFLVFAASRTSTPGDAGGANTPSHGAHGPGHVAFAMQPSELEQWRRRLGASGIEIESEVEWPRGRRSIYFRDPAGNLVELADPAIWDELK